MTREILFRGKRTDNGEWVQGYIYEHEAPLVCFSGDQKEDSKWYIVKNGVCRLEYAKIGRNDTGRSRYGRAVHGA